MGGKTPPSCRSASKQRGESLREALTDDHAKAEGKCYTERLLLHAHHLRPDGGGAGQELPAAWRDRLHVVQGFDDLSDMAAAERFEILRHHGHRRGAPARSSWSTARMRTRSASSCDQSPSPGGRFEPVEHARTRPSPVERERKQQGDQTLAEVVDVPLVKSSTSRTARRWRRSRAGAPAAASQSSRDVAPQTVMLTEKDLEGMDWEGAEIRLLAAASGTLGSSLTSARHHERASSNLFS